MSEWIGLIIDSGEKKYSEWVEHIKNLFETFKVNADRIIEELNKPSRAKQAVDFGNDESKWICEYCGENTWDVYNDYMGSGTNHLKCELEYQNEYNAHLDKGKTEQIEIPFPKED